jgi:hypothetical protein
MRDLPYINDSRNHRSAGILIWMNEEHRHRVLTLRVGGFCVAAARRLALRPGGWPAALAVAGNRKSPVLS